MDGAARRSRSYVPERGDRRFISPARPAKRGMPRPRRESGNARILESQKLDSASLGVTPAMKWNFGVKVEEGGNEGWPRGRRR